MFTPIRQCAQLCLIRSADSAVPLLKTHKVCSPVAQSDEQYYNNDSRSALMKLIRKFSHFEVMKVSPLRWMLLVMMATSSLWRHSKVSCFPQQQCPTLFVRLHCCSLVDEHETMTAVPADFVGRILESGNHYCGPSQVYDHQAKLCRRIIAWRVINQ